MAKNKRGRSYRLTPRRRSALHKAQLISARKRRGRRIAIAGGVAGGVGVLAGVATGAYLGRAYIHGLRGGPRPPQSISKEIDLVRIAPKITDEGKNNFTLVGRPARTVVEKPRRKRKLPNYVQWEQNRVKKAKTREIKNWRRRRKYWQSKPIGGK